MFSDMTLSDMVFMVFMVFMMFMMFSDVMLSDGFTRVFRDCRSGFRGRPEGSERGRAGAVVRVQFIFFVLNARCFVLRGVAARGEGGAGRGSQVRGWPAARGGRASRSA